MKIFLIFVMLFNINHYASKTFDNLKYTSRTVATPLMGNVEQPSVRAGFFVMETFDLFNQPQCDLIMQMD